jgi:putative ABC transport system permease protein
MNLLIQDLRHALRAIAKSPVITVVAVLTLALGIGATTAIFSITDALLRRLLPFPHTERLVVLDAMHDGRSGGVGPADFSDWRAESTAFQEMAYTGFTQALLAPAGRSGFAEPVRVTGAVVSDGFFPLWQVKPALGRWLQPGDQETGTQVVILSHELWRSALGGRADIAGSTIDLDGRSYTVVGVMPASFRFNEGYVAQYWVPVGHEASGRAVHQYSAYARLRPGVALASARVQMDGIAERLAHAYPETNTGWSVAMTPLRDEFLGDLRPAIVLLLTAAGVVLLIACANVASLLVARATGRSQELIVRQAIGASRLAIARLLVGESLLLALTAAVLGLVLAVGGVKIAASFAPAWLDLASIAQVDRSVFAFTTGLALAVGVATGLVPALLASGARLSEQLKQGTLRAGTGVRHSRTLAALVAAEFALATVLVIAAGLLLRSFVRVLDVPLGFRAEHVLTVRLQLPATRYPDGEQRAAFYRDLLERVRGLPRVISAGAVDAIPLGGQYSGGPIEIAGQSAPPDRSLLQAAYREATPDYFETLGIALLQGRAFTGEDREGSEPVAVVNRQLARQFFPRGNVVGKRIRLAGDTAWSTIVGVVGDVRHSAIEQAEGAAVYFPHAQVPASHMFLAVRTSVPALGLAPLVQAAIRTLDPRLVPLQVRTMQQAVSEATGSRRHLLILIGVLGAVALGLAALGLGGVMWYQVAQRTREIGVRVALGAQRTEVVALVLRRGLALAFVGLGVGLAAALGLTRALASQLYGVGVRDPLVFLTVPLLLTAVGVVAELAPARRAASVDPLVALQAE